MDGVAAPAEGFSHNAADAFLSAVKTTRVESSHLITFEITLDANCVGVCADSTVTSTYAWIDKCRAAVLTSSTILAMTTSELGGAST